MGNLGKSLAVFGAMLPIIAACTNTQLGSMTPDQQAQIAANIQTRQYQSCLVYNASSAQIADKLKTLPIDKAKILYATTQQATKLCTTVMTNSAQAQTELVQALTTISALAVVNLSGVAK